MLARLALLALFSIAFVASAPTQEPGTDLFTASVVGTLKPSESISEAQKSGAASAFASGNGRGRVRKSSGRDGMDEFTKANIKAAYGRLPLSFEANRGQVAEQVRPARMHKGVSEGG